jgi:hypothetical protein
MSAAVSPPREINAAALLVSLGLHGAFLLFPVWVHLSPRPALPNSVAMVGNSMELEAPTPELAAHPGSPEPIPVDSEPPPVELKDLPPESASPSAPAELKPAAPDAELKPAASDAAPKRAAPDATEPNRAVPARAKPKPPTIVPQPRANPRAKPTSPSQPPPAQSSPGVAASDASSSAASAGTFGQEGLAPGVRRLGYAFTRAIPAASPADAAWRELPVGHVGTIRIELEIGPDNRLGALKRWQVRPGEPAPPAVLERMVERTLILLRAGQFALSGSNQPGAERLVIDVSIRDDAPDDEGADVVVQKKFEGAAPGRPGKAYFRYGTGRAVEAKVTIISSGK